MGDCLSFMSPSVSLRFWTPQSMNPLISAGLKPFFHSSQKGREASEKISQKVGVSLSKSSYILRTPSRHHIPHPMLHRTPTTLYGTFHVTPHTTSHPPALRSTPHSTPRSALHPITTPHRHAQLPQPTTIPHLTTRADFSTHARALSLSRLISFLA